MNTAPQPPPNHRWRSGDLFVHPATADQDVEWLILSTGSGGSDLLVVAADTEPQAGVGDLALPHDSPLAPLVIRCGASCRLDRAALDAAVPTGHLEEPWPHAALELADGVEHGAVRGTPLEREAEEDSELSHRRLVLDEARRRLAAVDDTDAPVSQADVHTGTRHRKPFTGLSEAGSDDSAFEVVSGPWARRVARTAVWQTAAGFLLATSLVLGWLTFDLAHKIDEPRTPTVTPVGKLLNGGAVRSGQNAVIASGGFWRLHLLVDASQAPDGFVVQISEPLGPGTDPLEVVVGPELLPQMIVEVPEDALTPGRHRLRLVTQGSGTVFDEFDVTFRAAPSPPSATPRE